MRRSGPLIPVAICLTLAAVVFVLTRWLSSVRQADEMLEAAMRGDGAAVRKAIAGGQDVNAHDFRNGWTPLMYAAHGGHDAAVDLLLGKGADPNARTKAGETALMMAVMGNRAGIARRLLEKGADVNAKDDGGKTALDKARQYRRTEMTALLKKAGAK